MGIVNSTNDKERQLNDAGQEIQEVSIMYLDIKINLNWSNLKDKFMTYYLRNKNIFLKVYIYIKLMNVIK